MCTNNDRHCAGPTFGTVGITISNDAHHMICVVRVAFSIGVEMQIV